MTPDSSPYLTPGYDALPPRAPAVWFWYVAYCIVMALLYLACLAGGIAIASFAVEIAAEDPQMKADEARIMGYMLSAISIPLILLFGVSPLLPKGKLAWVLGIINIAIGLTSACCLPVCIPLLIYWMKPELKAYLRAT